MPIETNMTNAAISSSPRRRPAWGRKLAWAAASLLGLLIVLYFVATSSAFLKAIILPGVGKALQADVTAGDISLSPFSQVIVRKLRVQTTGAEPLVTADEARVRYNLSAILRGDIDLAEVSLSAPLIQIVQEADGTSNLDPLLTPAGKTPAPAAKPGQTPRLAIKNGALKNGTVRFTHKRKDGSVETAELAKIDVAIDQFQNGQSGKITLAADLKLDTRHPTSAKSANDALQAKVTGTFDLGVDALLRPQTVKATARVDLSTADGAYKDWPVWARLFKSR